MDKQVIGRQEKESKRLFARSLNFTDAQYEEAIKRIDSFGNPNQLLVALLDVSANAFATDEETVAETDAKFATTTSNVVQSKIKVRKSDSCETSSSSASSHPFSRIHTPDSLSTASITSGCTTSTSTCENQSSLGSLSAIPQGEYCSSQTSQLVYRQQNMHLSSCQSLSRQKLQRSRSHQPTTTGDQDPQDLKTIYIDGSNVAKTHGKNLMFSWSGIQSCVDWFRRRQHKVKVLVPDDKCEKSGGVSPTDAIIIDHLDQIGVLIKTPPGCNDDMFIIEAARQTNGIIVTNDRFRDETNRSDTELRRFVSLNRLPYIFVDDFFIPANDPLGRFGPSLDEFLRMENSRSTIPHQTRKSLYRTKSHQRP